MQGHILIVEDDPELQDLYALMLESADYVVTREYDGGKALEGLCRSLPDLIILDIILDEVMGDVVLRRLRADPRTSRIPVVLVSVLPAEACATRSAGDEATRFLRKPFSGHDLLRTVAQALREARPDVGCGLSHAE